MFLYPLCHTISCIHTSYLYTCIQTMSPGAKAVRMELVKLATRATFCTLSVVGVVNNVDVLLLDEHLCSNEQILPRLIPTSLSPTFVLCCEGSYSLIAMSCGLKDRTCVHASKHITQLPSPHHVPPILKPMNHAANILSNMATSQLSSFNKNLRIASRQIFLHARASLLQTGS